MRWVIAIVASASWLWIGYDLFNIVWPLDGFYALSGALACVSVAAEIIAKQVRRTALQEGGRE